MKETDYIRLKILPALRDAYPGGFFYKTHGGPYARAGQSDILGCVEGRFVAIEIKMPGKLSTVTELQQAFLDSVLAAGGIAGATTTPEGAVALIEEGLYPEVFV